MILSLPKDQLGPCFRGPEVQHLREVEKSFYCCMSIMYTMEQDLRPTKTSQIWST
jgi:hypothetical protein